MPRAIGCIKIFGQFHFWGWGQAGAGAGTRDGAGAMMSNQKSLIRILNSRGFYVDASCPIVLHPKKCYFEGAT